MFLIIIFFKYNPKNVKCKMIQYNSKHRATHPRMCFERDQHILELTRDYTGPFGLGLTYFFHFSKEPLKLIKITFYNFRKL